MDKKNITIIVLVVVLIVLAILVAGTLMNNNKENGPIIYNNTIEGVGTFNTTNVTNFTLKDSDRSYQTYYIANDSIAQVCPITSSSAIEVTISESDRVNDSAKCHTIYKTTANIGEHKGEVRYLSILRDDDNGRYILISSADYNLTCMMVDSFKFI